MDPVIEQPEIVENLDKAFDDMSVDELEVKFQEAAYGESQDDSGDATESEAVVKSETVQLEAKIEVEKVEDDPIAKMTKELAGLQKLVAKQGNEIGGYRKMEETLQRLMASQQPNKETEEIDPADLYDPQKVKGIIDSRVRSTLEQDYQQKTAANQKLENAKRFVTSKFEDFDGMVDDIASISKEMLGNSVENVDEILENFKKNPYAEDPMVLAFAAKTVKLQRELNELKAKSKTKGETLAEKISKAARHKTSTVGANSGQGKGNGGDLEISDKNLESMSMSELESLFNQLQSS